MATTSIVQLTADLGASTATGAVSQLLPSGTVLPFAGRNIPSGWLLCDGSEISKTIYPDLYAALLDATGNTGVYDTQVNPTTGSAYSVPASGNFRLPDYRGLFLRGTGTASGGDPTSIGGHQPQKTAKNGLTAGAPAASLAAAAQAFTGSSVNSGGMSANADHSHTYGYKGNSYSVGAGNFGALDNTNTSPNTSSKNLAHVHSVTAAGTNTASSVYGSVAAPNITGDNETRPVNKGINYIIKV